MPIINGKTTWKCIKIAQVRVGDVIRFIDPISKKKSRVFEVTKIRQGFQGYYLNYKGVKFTGEVGASSQCKMEKCIS